MTKEIKRGLHPPASANGWEPHEGQVIAGCRCRIDRIGSEDQSTEA